MSVKVKKTEKKVPQTKQAERAPAPVAQHPLLALREEVDHLFDNFFSGFALGPFSDFGRGALRTEPFRRLEDAFAGLSPSLGSLSMKTDVHESDDVYCIEAELPGLEESDVEVTVTDNMLTISGEKTEQKKEEHENYHMSERHYGAVKRTFPIPEAVDVSKAEATFKNGVLKVAMPKTAVAKPKATKIPISGH